MSKLDYYNTYYSKVKNEYYRRYTKLYEYIRTKLTGKEILELGCGIGYLYENYLKEVCKEYLGIDVSSVAIERAKKHLLNSLCSTL